MPPVDRNNPVRGTAGATDSRYSLMEFIEECPTTPPASTCSGASGSRRMATTPSARSANRRASSTASRRVAGVLLRLLRVLASTRLAGTIFHKSSTSLHLWFYAIYIMASTRCGVSAKHLERELGVTYKTAWRMFNLIRNKLMTEDERPLTGYVEVDETSVDGSPRSRYSTATDPEARVEGDETRANVVEQRCSPPSSVAGGSRRPSCRPPGPAHPQPGRGVG